MYNPLLRTFIGVADCGSFTKAAEALYISPTSVMKQINSLEDHLGLKLFDRKPNGVTLTFVGRSVYKDARFIIDYSANALSAAVKLTEEYEKTFCIGTSLLNPAKPFMDIWYRHNKDFADYKLHLVPFDDNHKNIMNEINSLGEKFDFLIGVCDSKLWLNKCNMLFLGRYRKMCAVSKSHRLASKAFLTFDDLSGETLMMVSKGDSDTNDSIRKDIETNHPTIKIEDTAYFYDMSVFNRCAESNNVLLTLECWKDVHPNLVTIPVEWDYSIPYGLLYALNPPEDILRFVRTIEKARTDV
ncbi:MAG: LysR family transcriptional regulator [Clostridia bacterium]|nr:LysR family transcriptional regulator [Clostridia bacterium]